MATPKRGDTVRITSGKNKLEGKAVFVSSFGADVSIEGIPTTIYADFEKWTFEVVEPNNAAKLRKLNPGSIYHWNNESTSWVVVPGGYYSVHEGRFQRFYARPNVQAYEGEHWVLHIDFEAPSA